mgnify:FL=1
MVMWINQNFLLQEDVVADPNGDLNLAFLSLRGSGPCHIKMDGTGTVNDSYISMLHITSTTPISNF